MNFIYPRAKKFLRTGIFCLTNAHNDIIIQLQLKRLQLVVTAYARVNCEGQRQA